MCRPIRCQRAIRRTGSCLRRVFRLLRKDDEMRDRVESKWCKMERQINRRWGGPETGEFEQVAQDMDALADEIERRTGESRAAIKDYLEYLASDDTPTVGQAIEGARQYAFGTAVVMSDLPWRLMGAAREVRGRGRDMVQQRPSQSLLTTLAVGLCVGVSIGLMLRSRRC